MSDFEYAPRARIPCHWKIFVNRPEKQFFVFLTDNDSSENKKVVSSSNRKQERREEIENGSFDKYLSHSGPNVTLALRVWHLVDTFELGNPIRRGAKNRFRSTTSTIIGECRPTLVHG